MIKKDAAKTQTPGQMALARWSAPSRPWSMGIVVFQAFSVIATIGFAFAFGQIVTGWQTGDIGSGLIIATFCGMLRAGFGLAAEVCARRASDALVACARKQALAMVRTQGPAVLSRTPIGAALDRLTDRIELIGPMASRYTPGMRLAVIAPLLVLVAVATQSKIALYILLVCVPLMPVFLFLTGTQTSKAAREQQQVLDTLSGRFYETLTQVGTLKAFNAVERHAQIIASNAEELKQRTMRILRRAFLSAAVLEFFSSLSVAFVAVYVGLSLLGILPFDVDETITLAQGVVVLMLAPEFFAPLRRMAGLHHDKANALAAADQIAVWLEQSEPEPAPGEPEPAPLHEIALRQGRLKPGGGVALPVTFDVTLKPGELTVIAGPSGIGKTSLFRALLGTLPLAEGSLYSDGRPSVAQRAIAPHCAYMAQTPYFFEGTIGENVRAGLPQDTPTDQAILNCLQRLGLDLGPEGLSRRLGRQGAGLSGGQLQRLAIARVLLSSAPIWLLDEPTAHLGDDDEKRVIEALRASFQPHRFIIVSSHRPAVLAAADTALHLAEPDRNGVAA